MEEFLKIKYIVDVKILIEFIGFSNNPNNLHFGMFSLVSYRRKCIAEKLGIRVGIISSSIRRLKELGIIRGNGCAYQISYDIMKYFKVQNVDKKYYRFEDVYGHSPEFYEKNKNTSLK